jgi:uncharacterized protein (TIGR03086 family)
MAALTNSGLDHARMLSDYRAVCDGFGTALHAARDRWDAPTPAAEGNVGQVFEHVAGNHESLLLRPLHVMPESTPDDPETRWASTVAVMFPALEQPGALDSRELLIGILTGDVLVHTWDLYRAVGQQVSLDPALCEAGYECARKNQKLLEDSGALGAPVAVPDDAPVQERLLGFFGRDPDWGYPAS